MTPTPALIAQAAEQVCARLGLDADAERAVALAVEIATAAGPGRIDGLTPTETRIVAAVRTNAGRVVNNAALAEIAKTTVDGALKVHISRIRKKRPDIGAQLETIHSIGYRWAGSAPDGAAVRP